MTKTTDSRQLGIIFQGVLQKHGVWDGLVADGKDLLVEMDLVMAAKMYFADFKSKGAVATREDIFKSLELAATKSLAIDEMMNRVKIALGINPSSGKWDDVIHFLLREDAKGMTIELFAKACEDDKFNMPKAHQIAMNPSLIMSMWPKAFQTKKDLNPQKLDVGL